MTLNIMTAIMSPQLIRSTEIFLVLVLLACYHNSICVCLYLLWAALVPLSRSPWRKFCNKGDEQSFLHITGLTRQAFNHLLRIVSPPSHTML